MQWTKKNAPLRCGWLFIGTAALFLSCDDLPPLPNRLDAAADVDTDADTDTDADADSDADTDSASLECEGGRFDAATGLCWQNPAAPGQYPWLEAIDYCNGLELAGHGDWILPSRGDFLDLLGGCDDDALGGNAGYCDPCAESEKCTALFGEDLSMYFSSTPYDADNSWTAYFSTGEVGHDLATAGYWVRCVREAD